MSESQTNIYEGLFLFNQSAAADLQSALDHVTELLDRAKAEIVSLRKWDERRLAYEIKGNKRGVYFLAYFKSDPNALIGLERDCNLSEQLLRSMVTRADHIPGPTIEAAEGRAQLADEIKLRKDAPPPSATATATVTTGPRTEAAPAAPAAAPAAPASADAPAATPASADAPAATATAEAEKPAESGDSA